MNIVAINACFFIAFGTYAAVSSSRNDIESYAFCPIFFKLNNEWINEGAMNVYLIKHIVNQS